MIYAVYIFMKGTDQTKLCVRACVYNTFYS